MIFELRIYEAAAGRLPDLVERIGSVMPRFFDRHGFGERLGQWIVATGLTPRFAWLVVWSSFEQRLAAFRGLGGDAEWNEVRVATNGPGEMVRRYDIRLLTPAAAWLSAPVNDGVLSQLYEWRVLDVPVGRTGDAGRILANVDLPRLIACGATLIAAFDNVSGPAVPGMSMLLGWASYEARRHALSRYEEDPQVIAARDEEQRLYAGAYVFDHADATLLEATCYGLPDVHRFRQCRVRASA